ncbi:uncharacterized protein [Rutidosis leptorrhynchoides]|uniref:uncharacterized protein n=1 Tax=Rutidosis leptorrhynchoides TaxID=125765 RepID=UPI003A99B7A9
MKIAIFIWRAKLGTLPTRTELDKRGIDLDSTLCPLCQTHEESAAHILITCPLVAQIWQLVLDWWNKSSLSFGSLDDAFTECQTFANSATGKTIWKATKWACGYTIWKYRNLKVFQNKTWTPALIISEIQAQSFKWISKRQKKAQLSWHQWLINPESFVTRTGVG